jgi:hypothetical protein
MARIAPSWISTSKVLLGDSKPMKWPTRSWCPVDETGMNSVAPSTTASTTAFAMPIASIILSASTVGIVSGRPATRPGAGISSGGAPFWDRT